MKLSPVLYIDLLCFGRQFEQSAVYRGTSPPDLIFTEWSQSEHSHTLYWHELQKSLDPRQMALTCTHLKMQSAAVLQPKQTTGTESDTTLNTHGMSIKCSVVGGDRFYIALFSALD